MSFTSGFFNAVDHDRTYDALQISRIFDGIIEDGVYASIGDHLQVVHVSGMDVAVGTGRAWFRHTWSYNDSDMPFTVPQPHALQDRFDAIVLEVNHEAATRENEIKYIEGTPSADPQLPTLIDTENVKQYPLAYIEVVHGITAMDQMYIINKVGSLDCPFVTGPLSVITTNELLAQWEAQFRNWFDFIMTELDEGVAGNLQNQIIAIVGDVNPPVINLLGAQAHRHLGLVDDGTYPLNGLGIENGAIEEQHLAPSSVTNSKISNGAITENKIGSEAVTEDKIGLYAVTEEKILPNVISTAKLKDAAVSILKLASNSVDDTKAGVRVPQARYRQGGNANEWDIPGTISYLLGFVRMQFGTIQWTGAAANSGSKVITFPEAFSYSPMFLGFSGDVDVHATGDNVTTPTGGTINWKTIDGSNVSAVNLWWIAIGTE